jgi:hypothetical protein
MKSIVAGWSIIVTHKYQAYRRLDRKLYSISKGHVISFIKYVLTNKARNEENSIS